MQQLVRRSVFATRLSQLLGKQVALSDIDAAINSGSIEPCAMAGVTPLFKPDQLIEVGAALTNTRARDFQHQVRTIREAAPIMRRSAQELRDIIESGDVPHLAIDNAVYIHMPTIGRIIRDRGL